MSASLMSSVCFVFIIIIRVYACFCFFNLTVFIQTYSSKGYKFTVLTLSFYTLFTCKYNIGNIRKGEKKIKKGENIAEGETSREREKGLIKALIERTNTKSF